MQRLERSGTLPSHDLGFLLAKKKNGLATTGPSLDRSPKMNDLNVQITERI